MGKKKKWPLLVGAGAAAAIAGGNYYIFHRIADRKPIGAPNERVQKVQEWMKGQTVTTLEIAAEDGLHLKADLLQAAEPSVQTVILVHGYHGSRRCDLIEFVPFYHEMGWNCLLVDNRGHGESDGRYVGFGSQDRRDILSWAKFLVERDGTEASIILHGWSMGGAIVLLAGGEELPPQVKGIVADCPYTSMFDQARYIVKKSSRVKPHLMLYGVDLWSLLLAGYRMRDCAPIDAVKKITVPVLFVHGTDDDFVPTYMGTQLYEACEAPDKALLLVEGAAHAMSYATDPKRYEAAIRQLISVF